jgi:hypothetical protein
MVKTKYTLETIKVFPLDMAKLNANFTDCHIHGKWAIVLNPKPGILTDECVGNSSDKIEFDLYRNDRILPDGTRQGSCMPEWSIKFTIAELQNFILKSITLKEFMAERGSYNSRIISNQNSWLSYFNS